MAGASKSPAVEIEVGPHTVRVSNPERVYFPEIGATKLDLVNYYLAVGPGITRSLFERPCMLHRYPEGTDGEKIYQKRLPKGAPEWIETAEVSFPSGRRADELCVTQLAAVAWAMWRYVVRSRWQIDAAPVRGAVSAPSPPVTLLPPAPHGRKSARSPR